MKRILIVCGTGMITSTVVANRIRTHCAAKGIQVAIEQKNVAALAGGAQGYDLVVATTQVPRSVQIPSINAVSLLTGVGAEKVLEQIEAELRK